MKSTFLNMVLVLFVITAISAAAVGYVYGLTKEPISQAKAGKKLAALEQVLPAFDNDPAEEMTAVTLDGMDINIYTGRKGGEIVGYAVESLTNQGFNGNIRIMAGFDTTGKIVNIEMLEQAETPGLGAKLADKNNVVRLSFVGNNPADLKMSVKKDGGDIDAITASTVSSRAYVDAVARAYRALVEKGLVEGTLDGSTGATSADASSTEATGASAETTQSTEVSDGSSGTTTDGSTGATSTDTSSTEATGAAAETTQSTEVSDGSSWATTDGSTGATSADSK